MRPPPFLSAALLAIVLWLPFSAAMAAQPVQPAVALLEDSADRLDIDAVRTADQQGQFRAWSGPGEVNLGFTRSTWWLRLTIPPSAVPGQGWLLEIPYVNLDQLDVHAPGQPPVLTGAARPFASRPLAHRFFAFPLMASDHEQQIYLRVRADYALTVPLALWTQAGFFAHDQGTWTLQAMYHGGLLALVAYNFFLWLSLKDRRFLLYSLFCGLLGTGILAGNGFGRVFLWPDAIGFDAVAQTFFISLGLSFGTHFALSYLDGHRIAPRTARVLGASSWVFAVIALLLLLSTRIALPLVPVYQTFMLSAIIASVLILGMGVVALRSRVPGVRFFVVAWTVLLGGGIIASLRAFGLVPTNTFTGYSVQISSAAEMLLLALALADTVRHERDERERAQREALASNRRVMTLMRQNEQALEKAVDERTERLNIALNKEKEVLEKYVRFSSLISHEFRNPLGIIDSQVSLMRKELATTGTATVARLDTIAAATRRLVRLFEQWMSPGHARDEVRPVRLQSLALADWLLRLLGESCRHVCQNRVRLMLDPAVVSVTADPELLDIALVNLIDNACKYSAPDTEVRVTTLAKPGHVGLRVSDEGTGIAPEHHALIFEDYVRLPSNHDTPGTGLGLAFVQSIATSHGGHVELQSAVGEGSTFTLWLPVAAGQAREAA